MIRQEWDVEWYDLETECPKNVKSNITMIVNYAEEIEYALERYSYLQPSEISEEDHEDMVQEIISLRSKINTISLEFLKLLKLGIDQEQDKEVKAFKQIQASFSKLFTSLEKCEKDQLGHQGMVISFMTSYITTLDTILYALIFHSLRDAVKNTTKPEMFSIELWAATKFSFDVFRYQFIKEEEGKASKEEDITYEELKDNKEEKLKSDLDKKIKDMRETDSVANDIISDIEAK